MFSRKTNPEFRKMDYLVKKLIFFFFLCTRNQALRAWFYLEYEMWKHFNTKQKSKSFIYFVRWCVIVWFTLTLNF